MKSFNSLLDKVIASVDEARESWEKQSNRLGNRENLMLLILYIKWYPLDTVQPNPPEETRKLVSAYLYGTGTQSM